MNEVVLIGKVSRVGPIEYTPSGIPTLELGLAARQNLFGREDFGYFEVIATGDNVATASKMRVGTAVSLTGSLWQRCYRNRKGQQVSETKVVLNSLTKVEEK
ncbi:MAG: single-stranded DNA-binding protein [Deltaproteobacteria bacterium]|nr:single-stranded DNA-binding protein [Deltaproteobacteria bacterium]MBI3293820.1 single-stranded DNA-binding protein [Deltaproteobacteria bacterium]